MPQRALDSERDFNRSSNMDMNQVRGRDNFYQRGRSPWAAGLITLALLMIAVVLILARGAVGSADQVEESPVAVINGEAITSDQYLEEVRLSETKKAMAGRSNDGVDGPTLFNRMIGDVLMLQGAREKKVSVEEAQVQQEIAAILKRMEYSVDEMNSLLADHDLEWSTFERSVRDYLILSAFVDEVILDGVQAGERQDALQAWMREQYQQAEMEFDQTFLDSINSPVPVAG